jgi:hypothetical protein
MPPVFLAAFRLGMPSASSRDGRADTTAQNRPAGQTPSDGPDPGAPAVEPTGAVQVARRGD